MWPYQAQRRRIREILEICNETSCDLMNLPGMYQLYTGEVSVSKMKEVSVEDLLGRDPIKVNMEEIFQFFLIFMKIMPMIFNWN